MLLHFRQPLSIHCTVKWLPKLSSGNLSGFILFYIYVHSDCSAQEFLLQTEFYPEAYSGIPSSALFADPTSSPKTNVVVLPSKYARRIQPLPTISIPAHWSCHHHTIPGLSQQPPPGLPPSVRAWPCLTLPCIFYVAAREVLAEL